MAQKENPGTAGTVNAVQPSPSDVTEHEVTEGDQDAREAVGEKQRIKNAAQIAAESEKAEHRQTHSATH